MGDLECTADKYYSHTKGWLPGEKTASFTVYAKWTPEKRSIVYKAGYGSYDDIQFEIDYDSEIIIEDSLFIPPKNKKFLNWSLNGSDILLKMKKLIGKILH